MQKLQTGAELRVTGPRSGAVGAVVCMNGGQGAEVEGTWSATLEYLVGRLAPQFPQLAFGEVRYRIKSWNKLDWCADDARAAIDALGAKRTLLLGFSMGGAVSALVAADASVQTVVGLAPWFPHRLSLDGLAGRRLRVLHGSLDRWLPGIPGVSPTLSRRGFERALALGASGEYTLIHGGLHGVALRSPAGPLLPLPRARSWVSLIATELRRFAAG